MHCNGCDTVTVHGNTNTGGDRACKPAPKPAACLSAARAKERQANAMQHSGKQVCAGVTWEEWLACEQLRKNAAHTPVVHCRPVLLSTQQQLRRPAPAQHPTTMHQHKNTSPRASNPHKQQLRCLLASGMAGDGQPPHSLRCSSSLRSVRRSSAACCQHVKEGTGPDTPVPKCDDSVGKLAVLVHVPVARKAKVSNLEAAIP